MHCLFKRFMSDKGFADVPDDEEDDAPPPPTTAPPELKGFIPGTCCIRAAKPNIRSMQWIRQLSRRASPILIVCSLH